MKKTFSFSLIEAMVVLNIALVVGGLSANILASRLDGRVQPVPKCACEVK